MTNTDRSTAIVIAIGLTASFSAHATLGIFEHGTGIKSLAYGGVSYIGIDESTALSANPALALGLGSRFDIGTDLLIVRGGTRISGSPTGPDEYYRSNGKKYFPIPQMGLTVPIAQDWAFGMSAFAAGLGPDYPNSPYARFAQTPEVAAQSQAALNTLKVAGISLVVAHELLPGQSLGLSANLQHQSISIQGTAPFASASAAPEFVGDQGQHGAFGASFTLGWTGTLQSWLSGALSYRSPTWTQKFEQYRGILPDQGKLALPSIFGGALLITPNQDWRLALEYQHFHYQGSNAFSNTIDLLSEGRPLGSSDGPGFGWNNQNVYKVGLQYQVLPSLILRTGASYGTQIIPRSQTLFNGLAPATVRFNFTGGFTYAINADSEVSLFAAASEHGTVRGENSIPLAFGGGEADVDFQSINAGLSYGRRFGKSRAAQ